MSEEQRARENDIFAQELSLDDLEAAAGGVVIIAQGSSESDINNCVMEEVRNLYGGNGFPNCANTVSNSGECDENDACYHCAIVYEGRGPQCGAATA